MIRILTCAALILLSGSFAVAQDMPAFEPLQVESAFGGAKSIDLRTSRAASVVTLRDEIKIPPPSEPVFVKTFDRKSLPSVLKPAFKNPQVSGVTIGGKYIAILQTDLHKEYKDILCHELVHAYISLASPKPLPFWFQEGSAVHFSTDKERKFYGQPSDKVGVMVGKTVELNETYKQKLRSFHFLIDKVGVENFNKWYRQAVVTGSVDARPLLGLKRGDDDILSDRRPFPLWLGGVIAVVVVAVIVIGYYSSKRTPDVW